jgi:hypothetical protein
MSLWRRLERALGTFATVELEDGSRFGANGEDNAGRILAGVGEHVTRNPVVPHARKRGAYLEGDFLIYAHGSLFAIEIKSLRGTVAYAREDGAATLDRRRIVQAKPGNYGEGVFYKEYSNPLAKTAYFSRRLRDYLGQIDPRFCRLPIVPVG